MLKRPPRAKDVHEDSFVIECWKQ